MKHLLIVILLTTSCLELFAEKIDGPANIRREPSGEKFISLYDNVEVTCTEIENNWYQIGFAVKLTKEQYEQSEITITAGTKLYNLKNKLIGETLIDLTFSNKMMGGSRENRWYGVEWIGYSYKSNIRTESIPENELRNILIQNGADLTESHFATYLKEFDFTKHGLLASLDKNYSEYMIYENWIDDPSPMDRIRLIFSDSKLKAIIHTRDLGIHYLKSQKLVRGRKIAIVEKMSSEQESKFIEMNIRSYNGVD